VEGVALCCVQMPVRRNVKPSAIIKESWLVFWLLCCSRLCSPGLRSRPRRFGQHKRIQCNGDSGGLRLRWSAKLQSGFCGPWSPRDYANASRWQMPLSEVLPFRLDWTNSMRLGDTQANRAGSLREERRFRRRSPRPVGRRRRGNSAPSLLPLHGLAQNAITYRPSSDVARVRTKGADLTCTPCS
jgi:hypothetical protein